MQYEMNILNKVEAKLWFTIEVYKVIYYAWPVNASRFRCKFDLVATVTYLLALSRTLSFDTTCYACTLAATQSYLPCRISIELQGLYNFLKQQYCSMYSIKLLLMVFFYRNIKNRYFVIATWTTKVEKMWFICIELLRIKKFIYF